MRAPGWVMLLVPLSLLASPKTSGQITAFWQQVTITPQAIADDPALANMQCWDLNSTTTGNWTSAGLRAWLPPGSFYYKHPMGGFKKPSPAAIAAFPALEFTPYVNTPNDNGLNNSNTNLAGGFEGEPASIGDPTAPIPGIFSVTWGDFVVDPPETYQIARLAFPQGVFPNIVDNNPRPFTLQLDPDASVLIPNIPEPGTIGWIGFLVLSALRRRSALCETGDSSVCQPLEARRLLSFSASFPGGGTLTPDAAINASNTGSATEGEVVIAVNPNDPRKVATYAVDGNQGNSQEVWYSSNGGLSYAASVVPTPAGQLSKGDPAVAFDRFGNLYVAQLTTSDLITNNVSIAKSPDGGQTWTLTKLIDNSGGADKPWIMTAPNPSEPGVDSVYVTWGGNLVRSDDGGMNFSVLPSGGVGDSFRIVARADGQVLFAAWWNRGPSPAGQIKFDWGEYVNGSLVWHDAQNVDTSFVNFQILASPGTNVVAAPGVAMDTSGRAFISYTKRGIGDQSDTDVWVARNADPTAEGCWSLTRLRDGNTNSQFQAFVSVDPMTGVPFVGWLDTANDRNDGLPGDIDTNNVANDEVQRFSTVSLNGGLDWQTPRLVSEGVSRPYSPFSYGHYNGNTAFAGMGYDSWPSNAHSPTGGPLDIYTDRSILDGHLITVTGTSAADTYHVQMGFADEFIRIWENTDPLGTATFTMHKDALAGAQAGLLFNLEGGNDTIVIYPGVTVATTINGGAGDDTITVVGGSTTSEVVVNTGDGNDVLNVNTDNGGDARVRLDSTEVLGALNVGTGGGLLMSAHGERVLRTRSLSVEAGGFIDLADNEMIVDYPGPSSPLGTIKSLITSGYNGGAWTGNGIRSLTAAAAANDDHPTALGYAEASELYLSFPATFAGQLVDDTAVLIRYTYYGDATLDGSVSQTDFNRVAANYSATGTTWWQGNFNFDNVTNMADFNLLASNYGRSGLGPGDDEEPQGFGPPLTIDEMRLILLSL